MYKLIPNTNLILASASPRRKELLSSTGLPFTVKVSDVDETALLNEDPQEMTLRLSCLKAQAVAKQHTDAWVIGADTIVLIDDQVLCKPKDREEAFSMLKQLSGRKHIVYSAISLVNVANHYEDSIIDASEVKFVRLHDSLITSYINSGEPLDKAGAYAIQGQGSSLIESITGSYTNIVGMNLSTLMTMLAKARILQID